ncbi:SlyX family protein [Glaciimonas sp. PAMC28666]|nr:SlyX family protein [Glaciimonas sp. PAMC28666]QRX84887.1 SlyX family protein [Glaciimonas sp. PAMC28666]
MTLEITQTAQEERFIAIEIKVAHQEDLMDELNKLVYRQQQKIDQLETLCAALARLIKDARESGDQSQAAHERPPHY